MSLTYWIPFFIIVIGNIGYHLVAKATPSAAPPFLALSVTYLGTDAGGCRIWLYPAIPDWLENQYGLAPGQCQRGAPPGRYRRPVL